MAESTYPQADGPTHKRQPKWWDYAAVVVAILFMAYLLAPAFQTARSRSMPPSFRNLKQIGLALHQYHYEYGCFPPAFTENSVGTRMHSWRVLILPYLAEQHEQDADRLKAHRHKVGFWDSFDVRKREQIARKKAEQIKAVMAAYDFSEPWNGPHNRKLSDQVLDAFCCNHSGSQSTTDYLAVVGDQTAWPEHGVRRIDDFGDGLFNTILVVESIGSGIPWSEPRDLEFGTMSFVVNDPSSQGIQGKSPNSARILMADGSVSYLMEKTDPADVKAMFTINGGEDVQ